MAERSVVLEDQKWQQVLAIIGSATGPGISWAVTNPLLMEIGAQVNPAQAMTAPGPPFNAKPNGPDEEPLFDPGQSGLTPNPRRVPRN